MRRRRTIQMLVAGLTVVAAEMAMRLASGVIVPAGDWYNRFADAKIEQLRRGDDAPEIVVLGDSSAAAAIDPHRLASVCGAPAYNAAVPGATFPVVRRWLHDAVLPHSKPRIFVLALTSRSYAAGPGALRAYEDSPAIRDDWAADLERNLRGWSYLVRYRRVLRSAERLTQSVREARNPDSTGWSRLDEAGWDPGRGHDRYTLGDFANARTGMLRRFEIGRDEVEDLSLLLDDLAEAGTAIVLVDLPVSEDWIKQHPRGTDDITAVRAMTRTMADEYGAVLVEAPDVTPGGFSDPIHVNAVGAMRVTAAVADAMPCGGRR